jgi:hypothetical protein
LELSSGAGDRNGGNIAVLQRVKRGELEAVHVMRGKQKGLRVKVIAQQPGLFDPTT